MDTGNIYLRGPVLHKRWKGGPVNGADAGQHIYPMLVADMADCTGTGKAAPHPQFHVLSRMEACTAAATKSPFPDGLFRHFIKIIADLIDNITRLLEHTHASRHVAGIMIGQVDMIIALGIKSEFILLDKVGCKLAYVDCFGGGGILKPGPGKRGYGCF